MARIFVGTSGWTYDSWRGPFYPTAVPKKDWLRWYAGEFGSTEINGAFYRTPSEEAVRAWHDQTPPDFLFAWKASKFITHWKRLTEKCDNSLALMETRLRLLKGKLGPVLFQLPPQFAANRERLASFLRMLPNKRRYAFEFRDASWYEPAILDLLRENDIALCLSDHRDAPAPWEVTASHVYVRGHGPTGAYKDRYPERTLRAWAEDARRWRRQGRDVVIFFDNDQKSAAPLDARRLNELLAPHPAVARRGPARVRVEQPHARRVQPQPARRNGATAMATKQKTLDDLFHETLKDIYYAEKKILGALPKMSKAAQSDELRAAFDKHESETERQVERLEQIFEMIEHPARGKKCDAIEGIIDEGKEIMQEFKGAAALDAGLLSAAQAVEHYEISRYGTLKTWAQQLGLDKAVKLLDETLNEEKKTDVALTKLAETAVNQQAQAAE